MEGKKEIKYLYICVCVCVEARTKTDVDVSGSFENRGKIERKILGEMF